MKKLICMACALILLLGLAGCKEAGPSLYDQGMKTVALLAEAIRSEEYLDLMTVAKPLREIISDAAAGDYSVPKAAFQLTFPDEALQAFAGLAEPASAPQTLADMVNHRLISGIIPQINAMGGAEILAASTVGTVGRTFVSADIPSDTICLYFFESGHPVAVTFATGEDNTVTASASLILYENFPDQDMAALQALFGGAVKIELLSE